MISKVCKWYLLSSHIIHNKLYLNDEAFKRFKRVINKIIKMTDIHKPSQLTTENKLQQSQKFTENTLKSAKKILEIAVNCVILLEEHKISPETVSSYKLQLSKLQHELEVREIQSEESAMLSPMYVQSLKNKIEYWINQLLTNYAKFYACSIWKV